MPSDRIKSKSPFVVIDNQGVTQEIKVVEIGNPSEPLIAGYSYVEATGSTYELFEQSKNLLQNIYSSVSPKIPTSLLKKRISNFDYYEKTAVIDWSSEASGSFRICAYDPERKNVIIYNDSEKDLFISVDNDKNPKISIDFINALDIDKIKIRYTYKKSSVDTILFDYNINDINNFYSSFIFLEEPAKRYGSGIENKKITNPTNNNIQLSVYLTPDYYPKILNKFSDAGSDGVFSIYIEEDGDIESIVNFNINKSLVSKSYNIYTKFNGSNFINNSITLYDLNLERNGFDLVASNPSPESVPPEGYSYIIYSNESAIIDSDEAVFPMFGYLLKPTIEETIQETTIRVVEAK